MAVDVPIQVMDEEEALWVERVTIPSYYTIIYMIIVTGSLHMVFCGHLHKMVNVCNNTSNFLVHTCLCAYCQFTLPTFSSW